MSDRVLMCTDDELAIVMDLWERAIGKAPAWASIVQIDALANNGDTHMKVLRDKLWNVACPGRRSGKSVGWWLRAHRGRVVGGRYFRFNGMTSNGGVWTLVEAQSEGANQTCQALDAVWEIRKREAKRKATVMAVETHIRKLEGELQQAKRAAAEATNGEEAQ